MRISTVLQRPLMMLGIFSTIMLTSLPSLADGGGPGAGPGGGCRLQLGTHLVNFTAYQPQLAGNTPYCSEIPDLGTVAVVFDYEDKLLRELPVEIEITKKDGTRIHYQPSERRPTGTFTTNINFTEAGDYIARVAVVEGGNKFEAHVPFGVAENHGVSTSTGLIIATVLMTIFYFLFQSSPAFQATVKRLWAKLD